MFSSCSLLAKECEILYSTLQNRIPWVYHYNKSRTYNFRKKTRSHSYSHSQSQSHTHFQTIKFNKLLYENEMSHGWMESECVSLVTWMLASMVMHFAL